ncbi:head maturation protease, ClpP-related [Microbulbifer sp. JSM ZJ756]|uniref:head maturation protease, ClpP-related n=1 Tax=Microbulbifer sp. JSM ZJ756 TaxID=3376191 RepID=UPI0037A426E0
MPKWYEMKAAAGRRAEVLIYDYIGMFGVEARDFIDELNALDVDEIDLRLNTPGGSVFEGNAIYNALKRHKAKITSYVDGLAASMGSVIALAGERVIMADNAMYMIHNPWTHVGGDSRELRKTADTLDKLRESMLNIYHAKTGIPLDELTTMLDDETWLTASECVDKGFADDTVEGLEVAASFAPEKFKGCKRVPESLIAGKQPQAQRPKQPIQSGADIKPDALVAGIRQALKDNPGLFNGGAEEEPEPETYNHRTPLYARLTEIAAGP